MCVCVCVCVCERVCAWCIEAEILNQYRFS